MLAALRVMSYFPFAHPWKHMWTDWDRDALAADFAKVAALGANTVRVIVRATDDTFGVPPEVSSLMIERLRETVALAEAAKERMIFVNSWD